ncbi:hypothetical protein FALBO_12101 [Fusarium albosuccineum]|uniref:Uncharacterized protein n=1 Tax=Fusarium albosuccineum TaxID=1237068 RepID=A0A8H4L4M4_9HYPO|nr:hypothetical protein FALBO_12101 [Fusarium albosuccineum]
MGKWSIRKLRAGRAGDITRINDLEANVDVGNPPVPDQVGHNATDADFISATVLPPSGLEVGRAPGDYELRDIGLEVDPKNDASQLPVQTFGPDFLMDLCPPRPMPEAYLRPRN